MFKLTAVALPLALIASPTFAADLPASHPKPEETHLTAGGILELNVGRTNFEKGEVDVDDTEVESLTVKGAYSLPIAENFSAQFDGLATFYYQNKDRDDNDFTLGEGYLASHVTYRLPESGLIGAFAGIGLTEDNGDDDTNKFFTFGGLETQYYLGEVTLLGQAGYLSANDHDEFQDSISEAVFVRGGADYYLTKNTKFSADVSYLAGNRYQGDEDYDAKVTILGWGAGVKHKLASLPIGVSASYNGYDFKPVEDSDQPLVHEVRVGAFYQFGTSTLKANDRTSAGLDLPQLQRWVSVTTNEIQ